MRVVCTLAIVACLFCALVPTAQAQFVPGFGVNIDEVVKGVNPSQESIFVSRAIPPSGIRSSEDITSSTTSLQLPVDSRGVEVHLNTTGVIFHPEGFNRLGKVWGVVYEKPPFNAGRPVPPSLGDYDRFDQRKRDEQHSVDTVKGDYKIAPLEATFAPKLAGKRAQFNESPSDLGVTILSPKQPGVYLYVFLVPGEVRTERGIFGWRPFVNKGQKYLASTLRIKWTAAIGGQYASDVDYFARLRGFDLPETMEAVVALYREKQTGELVNRVDKRDPKLFRKPETGDTNAPPAKRLSQNNDEEDADNAENHPDSQRGRAYVHHGGESEADSEENSGYYLHHPKENAEQPTRRADQGQRPGYRTVGSNAIMAGAPPVGRSELDSLIVRCVRAGTNTVVPLGGIVFVKAYTQSVAYGSDRTPTGEDRPRGEEVSRQWGDQGFQAISTFAPDKGESLFSFYKGDEIYLKVWAALRNSDGTWAKWSEPTIYHLKADGTATEIWPDGSTHQVARESRGLVPRLHFEITGGKR